MLVTSIFAFPPSVFYAIKEEFPLFSHILIVVCKFFEFGHVKNFGKELTLSQTSPDFLYVCSTSRLKTLWEKEELLIMSNSSFPPSVFYPFGVHAVTFIKYETVVCTLFGVWKSKKFVIWETVNYMNKTVSFNFYCNKYSTR